MKGSLRMIYLVFPFAVAPTIKVKSKVVKVTTSSNANLECITEANPAANTYWLKSGDEMILSG